MKLARFWGLVLFLSAAAALPAEGLYVLGGLGGKTVYGQDFSDFYGPNYYGGPQGVGQADLSLGWRFPGVLAIEAMAGIDTGRQASAYPFGTPYFSEIQTQPMTTLAIGPVFCWDRPSWWFAESGTTEFGLRMEYASLSGSESATDNLGNPGNQNFSDSTLGFGIFIRLLNIWEPDGFNLGLEAGYDYEYFSTLTLANTSGIFAGNNGLPMNNYTGGNSYIDNSGGYIRIVFGWSQPTRLRQRTRQNHYWRRRVYEDAPDMQDYDQDGGGYDDNEYGN